MVERQSPELSLEPDKIGERAVKIHLSTWYEKMKEQIAMRSPPTKF